MDNILFLLVIFCIAVSLSCVWNNYYKRLKERKKLEIRRERKRQYYQKHKEEIREKAKKHYHKNKEQNVEKQKQYYQNNKDKVKKTSVDCRHKRVEKLKAEGCINPWAVIHRKAEPIYKEGK